MKKRLFILLAALVALVTTAKGVGTIDPRISWSASTFQATVNMWYDYEPKFENPYNVSPITFTSSNDNVAHVSSNGYISFTGKTGTAVITASFEGNASYKASTVSTTVTIVPMNTYACYWSQDEVVVMPGDTFIAPTLTLRPTPPTNSVTYSSTNDMVARIDQFTGELTFNGNAGTTTIKVKVQRSGTWAETTASYTIKCYRYLPVEWNSGYDLIVPLDQGSQSIARYALPSNWRNLFRYEIGDTDIAEIDDKGKVTPKKRGTTTVTAIFDGMDYYLPQTATKELRVLGLTPTLGWYNSSNGAYTVAYGDNCRASLNNPGNLPVTFENSNPDVATIDAEGQITPLAVGETVITAIFDGDDTYEPVTRSFTLTVTLPSPKISWPNPSPTTGHLGSTFDSPKLNNPYNVPVSYTSSDPTVATIDETGNVTLLTTGTTTISAIFNGNETYVPSTITYKLNVNDVYWTQSPVFLALGRSFRSELVNLPGEEINITVSNEYVTYDPETGIVTGVHTGRCYVIASYGSKSVNLTVWVRKVGDANYSGSLDENDVTSMIQKIIGSSDNAVAPYAPEDVNGDGRLDITDVALLIELLKAQ